MQNLNDYIKYLQCCYKALHNCGILDQVKEQIKLVANNRKYNEIDLKVSIFSLYDSDVNLANSLCDNPLKWIMLLEEVAFSTRDVLIPTTRNVGNARIYVNVTFTDVPPVENTLVMDASQIFGCVNRIITFSGLVVSVASGSTFTRSCSFYCTDRYCRKQGNSVVNVSYPEFSSTTMHVVSSKCKCGVDFQENISERVSEEYLEFLVIVSKKKDRNQSSINRTVACIARGGTCQAIQVGKRLYFIGYVLARGSVANLKLKVEINNALAPDLSTSSVEHLSWMKIWQLVPPDISRFEFGPSFMMAFMFADEVTVPGSYFLLKLLLMLLLLSNTNEHQSHLDASGYLGKDKDDECRYRPISLVITACDTNLVSKIINTAANYTLHLYQHGCQDHLLGVVSNKESHFSVEFGTLLGPEDHIVFFPNLLTLPANEVVQLRKVLEDRLVQPVTKPGSTMYQQPLLCKIWASIDLQYSASSFMEKWPPATRSLIESFDLVVRLYDPDCPIWEKAVSQTCLDNCCSSTRPGGDQYHQLYHSFLQNASRIRVTNWSRGAQLLLRGYYLIGRKCTKETKLIFPQSALSVLLQFATNLAKLNNRSVINTSDSLLAIYLYEFLYSSKSGVRLVNLSSSDSCKLSHIRFINESFLVDFQRVLREFQINLENLIKDNLHPMFLEE